MIAYEIVDLAIYVTGDGVGILARYPIPHSSNFGHVMIFSPNVNNLLMRTLIKMKELIFKYEYDNI